MLATGPLIQRRKTVHRLGSERLSGPLAHSSVLGSSLAESVGNGQKCSTKWFRSLN